MLLKEAIDVYLTDASVRCAKSTHNHYRKRLNPFRARFGATTWAELTPVMITDFISELNAWPDGSKKAPDTIRQNVLAREQLQKWLIDEGHIIEPVTKKKLQKPGGRKRELLPTTEETRAIMSHSAEDFQSIYRSLRLTGARPGELCGAKISHIDKVVQEIILHEHKTARKTNRPRRIAIGHPALVELIEKAIGNRTDGPIYLRANGRPWRTEILSAAFRKARDAAGLRKGLVLYLARHEHATMLYLQTRDLKTVADALGHTQLSTTMRYTRVDGDSLKKSQRMFNENLDNPV